MSPSHYRSRASHRLLRSGQFGLPGVFDVEGGRETKNDPQSLNRPNDSSFAIRAVSGKYGPYTRSCNL